MTAIKPTVRPIAPLTWSVSLNSHRATVTRTPSVQYRHTVHADTIVIHGTDGHDYTINLSARARDEAELLAYVVAYFNAVDDAQVECDRLLSSGATLTKKSVKALTTVMLSLSRGYGPVALTEQHNEGVFATAVAGLFVRYFGSERGWNGATEPRTFVVGDPCVVSSYNLKYTGNVAKITETNVWCKWDHINEGKQKRHTLASFRGYNRNTMDEVHEHNRETFMYI